MRLLLILGALSAFAPLSIDMYLPALPALGHEVRAGAAQVQLTLSACLLGLALGQMLAGPLSDALGRRRPLLVGVAVYAVASLLCVVAPSVGVLILPRFVQGLAGTALGGAALLAAVVGNVGLVGVLPALFVVVSGEGIVLPNATTLALSDHPRSAGSASALRGVLQYLIGAAAAPLVGLGGTATARPMGVVIAVLGSAAIAAFALFGRRPRAATVVVAARAVGPRPPRRDRRIKESRSYAALIPPPPPVPLSARAESYSFRARLLCK